MPCIFQRQCEVPNFTRVTYRYGICLSSLGVFFNWLGLAQEPFLPIRFLGIGLVCLGSFFIIAAMCRWIYRPVEPYNLTDELNSVNVDDVHVISCIVPLNINAGSSRPISKPPEYSLVADLPPSYEVAVGKALSSRNDDSPLEPIHCTPPPQYRSIESMAQSFPSTTEFRTSQDSVSQFSVNEDTTVNNLEGLTICGNCSRNDCTCNENI